ncbi:UTRA domain-containing protein [Sneathiella marina]|uniref:UTRA domain-containing protein n=1 Tax=Sneathiella marina TaxID=2950108 RepID=A0ABY4W8M4_9PROT|nr:UTRA domain-containing protein [Sneathiella marina]USG61624.1 UTRA domain-containing protein [Sneathiella marina]
MPKNSPLSKTVSYAPPKPLYEQVKSYVLKRISSGDWPAYCRLPSEHTMVKDMGISRMTIHRALRELTQAGFLERIQGVGTFVAPIKAVPKNLELNDIDQVIRARGSKHHCKIHFLQAEPADTDAANLIAVSEGDQIFRSYFVHYENDIPLMLEDRHVSATLFPEYLEMDFHDSTADRCISNRFALLSHEHNIQAKVSDAEISHFLALDAATACLVINCRTWFGEKIVSTARMVYPGDRYHLG